MLVLAAAAARQAKAEELDGELLAASAEYLSLKVPYLELSADHAVWCRACSPGGLGSLQRRAVATRDRVDHPQH